MAKKALVGEKVGMTQVWNADGVAVPVTVVKVQPCRVVQVKTADGDDGYNAVQVTYGNRNPAKLTKAVAGHYDKAGVEPGVRLLELRLEDVEGYETGQELTVELFAEGERVDVSGVSRGKGFSGAMKRHGFSGQGASHGAHKVHRAPGSVGSCATPARVFKGTRMAGRAGQEKVTTQNLLIAGVNTEEGLLLVRGAIPGAKGGVVIIRDAAKLRNKTASGGDA